MTNKKPSELDAATLPIPETSILVVETAAGAVEKVTKAGLIKGAGTDTLVLGVSAAATGLRSVALGKAATTGANNNSVAIGNTATVAAASSVSVGHASSAYGDASTAIGSEASAVSSYSTAAGFSSRATGTYSTAVGGDATANGAYATAIGGQAQATAAGAVAIGAQVINGVANTASIGARGLIVLESTGLGNPPANAGMLFIEDNGSAKSRLVIKWPDGTTEVLATQA